MALCISIPTINVPNVSDATSADEFYDNDNGEDYSTDWVLRKLKNTMRAIGGKTDAVIKLASSVYQLAMSAEEIGLFMLPLN